MELNKGASLSGSELAKQLGITRGAVWKSIQSLKKDGYTIEAVTNRGYCLREDNNILSEAGILPYLKCKEIGNRILVYDNLPSTNQEAKRQAESGAGHGTIILANSQTNGRGRKGRSFYSPPGSGIYMSIILHPLPKAEDTMLLTSAAAVAVAKAIEETAEVSAQIKWVNDIFVQGKKVCGILTEATTNLENGEIETIILGIGINVFTAEFPNDLSEIAASVATKHISRNQLIASVCNHLEGFYSNLPEKSFLSEYKARSMVLGKEIQVLKSDGISRAKAIDLNENAHLIVEYPDGTREALSSGEISIKWID